MVRAATALADSSPSTYLEKRKLAPPFVGPLQLAGFIIGIVISGAFTGWNTGLSFGFINMAVAVGLATVMYLTLVLSVCEMCSALPFASGPAAFAQAALNSGAAALTGGVYATSYTLLSATVLVSLGNFISASLPTEAHMIPSAVYWVPLAAMVLALNSRPRLLFRAAIVLSCYSCLLLLAYLVLAFSILPTQRQMPPNPVDGRTDLYYKHGQGRVSIDTSQLSMRGIIAAFPFACWLYVGIESFPTASEEARKIFRTAPTAVLYATFFLAFFAVTLLTTAPQVGGGGGGGGSNLAAVAGQLALTAVNGTATTAGAPPPSPPPAILADFSHSNHPLLDNALSLLCSRYPSPALPTWCQPTASPADALASSDFFHQGHPLITLLVLTTLLPPLFLSLITGTYAAARHIYTLSRAGVLPTRISKTGPHGAPNYATLITLACGIAVAGSIKLLSRSNMAGKLFATMASGRSETVGGPRVVPYFASATSGTGDQVKGGFFCPTGDAETSLAILQVSSWLACVSYVLEFGSYILLYVRVAQLPRPFASPLGVGGAALGLVLALALGVVGPLFVDPFFYGILLACVLAWGAIAVAYWVWVAKARMADSPEKIFVRLQIQQLYGRRAPGPVVSHSPGGGGGGHPPGDGGAGDGTMGQDRLLDGSDRGRDPGTRTVLLSPRPDLPHTLRPPGTTARGGADTRPCPSRARRTAVRRHPPSAGVTTLRVHEHSMPTLAVHSTLSHALPMSPMCTPPVPFHLSPPAASPPVPPAATRPRHHQGQSLWDWSTSLGLPAFLRYGSAWSYRPTAAADSTSAPGEHDANDDHAATTNTTLGLTSTLPLRREWTARALDDLTVTISHASSFGDSDSEDDDRAQARCLAPAAAAAGSPDPQLTPAIRRLTASSEAALTTTRDSGITDVSRAAAPVGCPAGRQASRASVGVGGGIEGASSPM